VTWRNRRKLSYLINDFDDYNLKHKVENTDNKTIVEMTVDFFENGSELIYPAKSYFVAIIYAKLLEKYFNENFYSALNYNDLLIDDKYFKPYSQAKEVYDGILKQLKSILDYDSTENTKTYFYQEFLINGTNNKTDS